MEAIPKLEVVLEPRRPPREGLFPMQEYFLGGMQLRPGELCSERLERPAAEVFAERLAESGSGPAAPALIP
ncbi:MAG: hypothetical protein JXB85_01900 [Anaerolineales bacterium]|nr:hypothetical protein [Anaerolineales bacterium]